MADSFPRRFGRYTLLEHLAQGGMGSLYLACQGETGMEKLCVVKTVLRELADKEYVARFRDEAKVVVRLSHGSLVPVFDAGTVDGELYIAMDYVDGRDLRAVWNRCADKGLPFPVDVAVYIVKELCRGLNHAHTIPDLSLVHRDVSPPNVLVAYSGEIKLTDFGLANSALKLQYTMPGIIYGKVSYMSPEQARSEPLDGRADLYAAGVILWELLTGRQLFPNSDGNALERVRKPEVIRPSLKASRVPLALDPIVMKALAPDRDQRYADCEAFRAALAGYLAREAPTIDNARVQSFLKLLFGEDIDRDRRRREQLIVDARMKLKLTLEPQSGRVASSSAAPPPPRSVSGQQPASRMTPGRAAYRGDERLGPPAASAHSLPPPRELPPSAEVALDDRSAGLVGTTIDGRYRVTRLVGEGGMGRVYEAEHIEIGKRVAIKVLHPTWSKFPELVARFRREARAASRIGHPNIIDVTDSGTTPSGAVYFVMELLEGRDLADTIHAEKAIPYERALPIAIQLCRALQAAHDVGVIHRDLKPENVFLVARPGAPDFVKVLDFGIARSLEAEADPSRPRLTAPNMAMGTPQYMAPEQAAGKPADARSDIYGVGTIVYEMLVGQAPHQGKNNEEILHRKLTELPASISDLRPEVPAALAESVATALARDPAKRQQSMNQLADELERCRPDRRRGPARPTQVVRGRAALRFSPVQVAVGAGALLVLGAAGVLVARSGPASPSPAVAQAAPGGASLPVAGRAPSRTTEARLEAPEALRPAAIRPAAAVTAGAAPSPPVARAPSAVEGRRALEDANRLLRDHQLGAAEATFRRLLDGSERGAAATGLARVAFEQGRYPEAVKRGERAVSLGGGAAAHRVLGDAYFKVQRYDAAVKEYRAVLRQKPDDTDAARHLEAARARSAGG